MSLRLLAAASAVAVFALGCPSPAELCKSGIDQVCERNHECQPDQVKASPQFQAAFGTSVDECKERLYANPGAAQGQQGIACEDVDSDQELCTNLGQPNATEFSLGKASECRDEREEMSCEDYLAQQSNPASAPQACLERCS